MPMHCSANVGPTATPPIFFGLSGTGKTTLSADPNRTLIGDDEHGWGGRRLQLRRRLLRQDDPPVGRGRARDLFHHQRFGTVLENVILMTRTAMPDFDDATLTENTRCAYPLHFIPNASRPARRGQPKNIIMLTCDAFGVMPPIAKLTPAQAMYHFLSGYTAKVAGTERA
jgi:phosphoenolpyruvate carboxykinase (ATP)